jgi:hypothetical protein
MKALWWTGMWCYAPGGTFSWTTSIYGLGGQNVSAEASLGKVVMSWGDPRFVKTSVWHATYLGGPMSGMSQNWGFDGSSIRWLANCNYMTFAIQVQRAFGEMTGKVYIH